MRKLITAVLMLLSVASATVGAENRNDELEQEVRKMLQLTGAANLGINVSNNMMAALKPSFPAVPEEFWVEFQKELKPSELVEIIIPIYEKNFTLEEIRAANAFYSTPEGRSIIQKMPTAMNQAMVAGQKWGQAVAERAVQRLKDRGLISKGS
jgi:uncharacterized protein